MNLASLTKYSYRAEGKIKSYMYELSGAVYVKLEDVKKLLKRADNTQSTKRKKKVKE